MLKSFSAAILRAPLNGLTRAYQFKLDEYNESFLEGIFLASKEFYLQFRSMDYLSDKEKKRILFTCSKYWLRSCTRATPFATFAGLTLVPIVDAQTSLKLDSVKSHTRRVSLDSAFLHVLTQALIKKKFIKEQLTFFPNTSLYETPNEFRYIESSFLGTAIKQNLISIAKTSHLERTMQMAATGVSFKDLVARLVMEEKVSKDEAEFFIDNLIASQVLVSELEPKVTGKDQLTDLIMRLRNLNTEISIIDNLQKAQQLLSDSIIRIEHLESVESILNCIEGVNATNIRAVKADLFLSMQHKAISSVIINKIISQVEELMPLNQGSYNYNLTNFKNQFTSRYGDAWIDLPVALDNDCGIGYGKSNEDSIDNIDLISDIQHDYPSQGINLILDRVDQFVLDKYLSCLQKQDSIVELSEKELSSLKNESDHFPLSMYIVGKLLKGNRGKDDFIFDFYALSGSSGANVIARYSNLEDDFLQLCTEIKNWDEHGTDEIIYAEIVHLSEPKSGNLFFRVPLSTYEIPYLGKSGVEKEFQIPISDLQVNVCNDEVILLSKRLKKRIIPRLTNAHNFNLSELPIYRFLCDLQTQGMVTRCKWRWGVLSNQRFLPRVIYKNLILAKASWLLDESDIKDLPKDENLYVPYFEKIQTKLSLPIHVVFHQEENELLIDLGTPLGIKLIIQLLKQNKVIVLEEYLFTPENCIVRDRQGTPFVNELIIPVKNDDPRFRIQGKTWNYEIKENEIQEKFPPGSEWLYFKIYCGKKAAETLLTNEFASFLERGLQMSYYEKFYFVRYSDESPHLRIRFLNTDLAKQNALQLHFCSLLEGLVKSNRIEKFQIDTYTREVTRYNEKHIIPSESLFFNDSLAALRILGLLKDDDSNHWRLLFGIKSVDTLLDDFHLTIDEKKEVMERVNNYISAEFSADPLLSKKLNSKYHQYQKEISSILEEPNSPLIEKLVTILQDRTLLNISIVEQINALVAHKAELFQTLLPSYIHMFINRLFVSNQRKYDLLLSHFLLKFYNSKIKRATRKANP